MKAEAQVFCQAFAFPVDDLVARGYKSEPELDHVSNVIKNFNDQFGDITWTDADRVHPLITQDIPHRVGADSAYPPGLQERT